MLKSTNINIFSSVVKLICLINHIVFLRAKKKQINPCKSFVTLNCVASCLEIDLGYCFITPYKLYALV